MILEDPGKLQEAPGKLQEAPGGCRRLQEAPESSREASGSCREALGRLQEAPGEGSQGPRRPTVEHDAGADAVPGSPGRHIKRTSITTDQQLEDLTRRGPMARRILCPQITEKQYGLSHQETTFSVPGPIMINSFYLQTPDHQKSIFSIPGPPKGNTFCWSQDHENQYICFPDQQISATALARRRVRVF